jgi:Lrp/AsnC family transcriptional regulator, regulator for asnA, asnC and gidA
VKNGRATGGGAEDAGAGATPDAARGAGSEAILDVVDRGILRCLREEGRMPNSEIARRLKVGEATVRRRLQRLQDSRILRVVPVVDPDSVGLRTSVLLGIKAAHAGIRETAERLGALPEVRYVALATGPYDLIVEAFLGSREHLADFLFGPLADVPGIVTTETMTILEIAKFAYEWQIPELPGSGDGAD